MAFELTDIKRVLDAFESGAWDRIHLQDGDSELLLSVYDEPEAATASVPAATASELSSASPEIDAPKAAGIPAPSIAPAPVATNAAVVAASSMGIFWRSPSPGAAPFVSIGDIVSHDTTVCIIEVMKLMHRICAGVQGVVVAVLVEDSHSVEAGQPLLIVEPVGI